MYRRTKLAAATLVLAPLAVIAAPVTAQADTAGPLGTSCTAHTSSDGVAYRFCTGLVPTWDGTHLDVDITLPAQSSGPLPTVLFMHGWAGNKTEWESASKDGDGGDKYHWNNVWFVSRGFAAVTYTARGFHNSCGINDSDPACAKTGTHVADRRWEIRDAQTLLGELVDAGVSDRSRLAGTGGSYGGCESWELATALPWASPAGTTLQLAAAVPKYGCTDLMYDLAPNGRQNDGPYAPGVEATHAFPFGIYKQSWNTGLYAVARPTGDGRLDPPDGVPDDPASNLDAVFARFSAGEPYDGDPTVTTFADDFRQHKSAWYADDYMHAVAAGTAQPVPILALHGWTDPLFPAAEAIQMYRKLKFYDPTYPISILLGDIGHPNAQNSHDQWVIAANAGNAFLGQYLLGQGAGTPSGVMSLLTECPDSGDVPETVYAAATYDQLGRGVVHAASTTARTTTSADTSPLTGVETDPIVDLVATHKKCLTTTASPTDAVNSWSWPVPAGGFTQLGLPRLRVQYTLAGADATLGFNLWDVAPDGTRTLADRGEYRLTALANGVTGTLATELDGNCWPWEAGHVMQLQVTQTDTPYLRPDNVPSSVSLTAPTLDVPTAEATTQTITAP